jgi:hypothetical protein
VTQALRVLISWTEERADSALAQKAASACRASSALRRSDLAGRSKKVSKFGDAALQLSESFDEIGHASHSDDECSANLHDPDANE